MAWIKSLMYFQTVHLRAGYLDRVLLSKKTHLPEDISNYDWPGADVRDRNIDNLAVYAMTWRHNNSHTSGNTQSDCLFSTR